MNQKNNRWLLFRIPGKDKYFFQEAEKKSHQLLFRAFESDNTTKINGHIKAYRKDLVLEEDFMTDPKYHILSKQEYKIAFDKIQAAMEDNVVSKTILSRVISIESDSLPAAPELFDNLCDLYPDAFVYFGFFGDFGFWGGATPELLLATKDGHAETVALAGTKTSDNPQDWTKKEVEEHRKVEEFIESLDQLDYAKLISKSPVYYKKAGFVYHQKSDFKFSVESKDAMKFANELHPTPAVCGTPREASKSLINHIELHSRDLYTGYIGLRNLEKDELNVYVNLRCFRLWKKGVYIFVGGGITQESDVEAEWYETIEKSKTVRKIFEKD